MAKQLRPLNGKVAAVTGGARGIGRATAAALLAQGARVAIGDLDGELTRAVADDLGVGVVGLALDVTSAASFRDFLDGVERELGPLDVLVNNAGIAPVGEFAREADATAARVLDVNVGGTMRGCKLALERMLPRGAGHIVNVSSGLGRTPSPGIVTYAASKHAVVGLTESLRIELDGSGVELHLILPNLTGTDMADGVRSLRAARIVTPEQVAAAIVDALRTGRRQAYIPRQLGWLIWLEALLPWRIVRVVRRLLGADRMFTQVDALERAAYEARIAPPAPAGSHGARAGAGADRAASVASAAASVADALRAGDGDGGRT
jgi:NAD(P)-dependent dehydrogenase (short-subunit alcohol dehydrogenase family)